MVVIINKIIVSILLLISSLLLTGCGSEKTLDCSLDKEGNFNKVETTLVYKNDKIKSGETVYTFDYSSEINNSDQLEVLKEQKFCPSMMKSMKEADSSFKDAFQACSESWEDGILKITITFNPDELNKKDNFKGIDTAKKAFENDNKMKCTIK